MSSARTGSNGDVFYFDSSALVKLLVAERESEALLQAAGASPTWATSILAMVEVSRAARARRDDRVEARVALLFRSLEIIEFDRAIVELAARLDPPALRSLDAIHIATALSLGGVAAFFAYGRRLTQAAGDAGLPVQAPT